MLDFHLLFTRINFFFTMTSMLPSCKLLPPWLLSVITVNWVLLSCQKWTQITTYLWAQYTVPFNPPYPHDKLCKKVSVCQNTNMHRIMKWKGIKKNDKLFGLWLNWTVNQQNWVWHCHHQNSWIICIKCANIKTYIDIDPAVDWVVVSSHRFWGFELPRGSVVASKSVRVHQYV